MRNRYKMILLSLLPAIVFIITYRLLSFRYAVIIGFVLGIAIYVGKYKRNGKLNSFDYLGIFGLVTQTIISFIAKNPKTYFIYPLVENSIYAIVFIISLIINKDVISYLAKDFIESEEEYEKCKPAFRTITYLWSLFFIIKVIIKVIGINSWSFEVLYIVNWLFGMPISIILLWFSFSYPDKYYKSNYSNRTR